MEELYELADAMVPKLSINAPALQMKLLANRQSGIRGQPKYKVTTRQGYSQTGAASRKAELLRATEADLTATDIACGSCSTRKKKKKKKRRASE